MTVTATVVPTALGVTIACAWCRREHGGDAAGDPRTIVGLCDEHVSGFFSRVDALLASFAELRAKRTRTKGAPAGTAATPEADGGEAIADLLRVHTGLTLCDACVAVDLGWPPARVTDEADRLDPADFVRDQWRCGRCGARGIVTRARTRRSLVEKQAA